MTFGEKLSYARKQKKLKQADLFKNPDMLKRFKDILSFPAEKQEHILFALDSMIKATKMESI